MGTNAHTYENQYFINGREVSALRYAKVISIAKLNARIAELSQAVGLITTLKPTMVMDTEHPLDMVREVAEHVTARIAELEGENNRLAELLHNELSSVEIATDLGNKRWVALNDIYENGEKHNTNWCKRKAQEGLGIKNG